MVSFFATRSSVALITCGAEQLIPGDDYPDYAERVANAIRVEPAAPVALIRSRTE